MRSKLQIQLEKAYQVIIESQTPPCPCTVGEKCTKKGCDCPACLDSLKESKNTKPKWLEKAQIKKEEEQGQLVSKKEKQKVDMKEDYKFESLYNSIMNEATKSYSTKKAHEGKDIGKPGKNFKKISDKAADKYGSKQAGDKVAGSILAKLRSK